MSTDLDTRLRALTELSPASHEPLGAAELHRRATRRQQRALALRAVPAVVVVVALLAGAVALAGRSSTTDVVIGPPDGSDASALTEDDRQIVDLASTAAELAHQMDREMLLSATYLATGGAAGSAELQVQRPETDEADAAFREALTNASAQPLDAEVDDAALQALNRLDRLSAYRSSVDDFQADPMVQIEQYDHTTATLADLQMRLALTSDRVELLRGLLVSGYAAGSIVASDRLSAQLTLAVEPGFYAEWIVAPPDPPQPIAGACGQDADAAGNACSAYWEAVRSADARAQAENNFMGVANGSQKQSYRAAHAGSDHDQLVATAFADGIGTNDLRGTTPRSVAIDPATWRRSALDRLDRLWWFHRQLIDSIGQPEPMAASPGTGSAVGTAPAATLEAPSTTGP